MSPPRPIDPLLAPLSYSERGPDSDALDGELESLAAELPAAPPAGVTGAQGPEDLEALDDALATRERAAAKGLAKLYRDRFAVLAQRNLTCEHAYSILFDHSRLLDGLHRCALRIVLDAVPALLQRQTIAGRQELAGRRQGLPRRETALTQTRARREDGEFAALPPGEREYYADLEAGLEREVAEERAAIAKLEADLPAWESSTDTGETLRRRLVLFARGGYGRGEMSFASDVDTGYCVDTRDLPSGGVAIFREVVMRTEALLREAGIETVHQYFETEEDLARFALPETLHTIPAILEARPLLGNPDVLDILRRRFLAVLGFEEFLKKKISDFEAQPRPSLTEMNLKEDAGGLRSIQIPLWILGIIHGADSFMTGDLLRLALERELISRGEAARLVLALELLYDLRNFTGAAERFYNDGEARSGNVFVADFPPNRLTDALARLYLYRRSRFPSLDALDAYRLRLMADVRRIAPALLGQLADREIPHQVGDVQVLAHLGRREVTDVAPLEGVTADAPFPHFLDGPIALLRLFRFSAESGYALSPRLRDALSELVRDLVPAAKGEELAEQGALFRGLMTAPHAHTALAAMAEINDPHPPAMETLLQRFIPEFGALIYLLRNTGSRRMALHDFAVSCVEEGQASLEWLGAHYPEFRTLLTPAHVHALKWSLLLHCLGRAEALRGGADAPDLAVAALERLGVLDEELEGLTRLLIEHHQGMALLSRTATYFDQGLVEFFEMAGREVVNVVLLFLINRAVLLAGGLGQRRNLVTLERFFDETVRILAELRGLPSAAFSLELINGYLDRKNQEQREETRLHQLVDGVLRNGWERAVGAPLRVLAPREWSRMEPRLDELEAARRDATAGLAPGPQREAAATKVFQALRRFVKPDTVERMTAGEAAPFSLLFSAFPNRYLLSARPRALASQAAKLTAFRELDVWVDVLSGAEGAVEGLLIYTRGMENPHGRVAYMLSRKRLNVISGKVNRVEFAAGESGYCYYFQLYALDPGTALFPREVEAAIREDLPVAMGDRPAPGGPPGSRPRVNFIGDDGKAYHIVEAAGLFKRLPATFPVVQVVMRDEPFLLFRVLRAFGEYDAEVVQALITTIGNQVVDYYYLRPETYDRLRGSNFEERFTTLLDPE